jgi:hypothetical protein
MINSIENIIIEIIYPPNNAIICRFGFGGNKTKMRKIGKAAIAKI